MSNVSAGDREEATAQQEERMTGFMEQLMRKVSLYLILVTRLSYAEMLTQKWYQKSLVLF